MNTFVRRDTAYVNNTFFVGLHKLQMYIKVGIRESKYENRAFGTLCAAVRFQHIKY